MSSAVESSTPSTVIDRISLVLDAFDGPGQLTLAQVVRRTNLPRSSAHRLLERLVQLRWLRRDGHDYALGMRLVELGSLAVHQDRLHTAAAPFLHELHGATGGVVHLAVLDGSDVLYLDKVGGWLGAAVPSRTGGRQPAHCTGLGKALLAFAGDEVLGTGNSLIGRTKHSISTPVRLRADLQKVRDRGVAFEYEESVLGFGCVAAPIGDVTGSSRALAAVSVCAPVERVSSDHRLPMHVRMTASGIWRNLTAGTGQVCPTLQRDRRRPGAAMRPMSH